MATTVAQLIEHLKQYPPETVVMYQAWSEPNHLDVREIEYYKAEDKKILDRPLGPLRYRTYYHRSTREIRPDEVFVTALIFPGN